ncbi:MAG TPA: hypothetical protein VN719_17060, partial [Gemmatimonadales bacterium]|nr:hypothetical protein [Gemmatimonadales bacterium]
QSPLAPDLRRLVDHHVEHCAACAERRAQLASPLDVFAALAPVAASAGARARVLGALADAWPEAMIDATVARQPAFANSRVDSTAAGRRGGRYQPALPTAAGWRGSRPIRAFAGLGVAAAAMLALLVLPGSPIALTRSQAGLATSKSGTVGNQQGSGDAGTAGPTVFVIIPETATATPTSTRTPAARGSVGAGISSTSSAQVGAGSPGAESSTATPTLVPPTPTQPPTVVIPPTATPTRQATAGPPTPTTVPTPCTGALTTNLVDNQLNASTGRTSFEILNQSDCASGAYAVAVVGAGAGWLTVSPSAGALSAHSGDTIGVTADLSAVPGGAAAAIRVVWPGGAFFVTVIVSGAEP